MGIIIVILFCLGFFFSQSRHCVLKKSGDRGGVIGSPFSSIGSEQTAAVYQIGDEMLEVAAVIYGHNGMCRSIGGVKDLANRYQSGR